MSKLLVGLFILVSLTSYAHDRPEGDYYQRASQYDCRATGSNNLDMEEVNLIQEESTEQQHGIGIKLYDYIISFTQLDDYGFNLNAGERGTLNSTSLWLSRNLQPGEIVSLTLCHEATIENPHYCLFIKCTKK